jgi:hypothetical protein
MWVGGDAPLSPYAQNPGMGEVNAMLSIQPIQTLQDVVG